MGVLYRADWAVFSADARVRVRVGCIYSALVLVNGFTGNLPNTVGTLVMFFMPFALHLGHRDAL